MSVLSWLGLRPKEEDLQLPSMKEILDASEEATRYSPDMVELEDYRKVALFVYDGLKDAHPQHDALEGGEFYGTAFTKSKFSFWKKQLGPATRSFALAGAEGDVVAIPRPIKGELYFVEPGHLFELDKKYENGVSYQRTRVSLVLPYRERAWVRPNHIITEEVKTRKVRAWMYLGVRDYWQPQLNHAITVKENGYGKTNIKVKPGQHFENGIFKPVTVHRPRTPWLADYYNLTPMEYKNV